MSEIPCVEPNENSTDSQSGTTAPVRSVRYLKEVEHAENEIIREALYSSPATVEEKAVAAELAAGGTTWAKEAREKMLGDALRPMKEKMSEFRGFVKLLGQPQCNRVVGAFIFTTFCMFTLPIIVLLIGMHLVAPALDMDQGICGGFMALGMVVGIIAGYIVYAFMEPDADINRDENKKRR